MARDKTETAHVENAEHEHHEAALAGAIALANLFSNCVEAFGLIHPLQKWDRPERLLLARLGIQQARLLIWGDVVGIYSPPKTVTDRAVPKHPSAAYPDLKEPTFFSARDARLDDPRVRTEVENALGSIVDRGSAHTREEMMEKFGLKPPKRLIAEYQAALDTARLEHFRERYELLQEVAEDYAHLNTRRNNSITHTSWQIADQDRFASFIALTQQQIDFLIHSLGVKDDVDRGMRMDIKAFGWHLTQDRMRVALDVSKLQLMQEACQAEYPEYLGAIQQALDNIEREKRENAPPRPAPAVRKPSSPPKAPQAKANGHANTKAEKPKRSGGLFGMLKNIARSRDGIHDSNSSSRGRSKSLPEEPPRSQSESAPSTKALFTSSTPNAAADGASGADDADDGAPKPVRSKSVGDIMNGPGMDEEFLKNRLQQIATIDEGVAQAGSEEDLVNAISRHDQYHGIGRVETRDQRQGW
ncbi:hypothetical protein B0A50_04486 [Salinomyces thailandicus]|uniref:Prion-inhibition and propagation HeLo domain-containing protein n=1 Tax=Salinomyces thailandicus TaxID=706561 RepID=A0A4V5N4G5_9PEZI|nr:hypothetical protein B0A50_04486 [Salinomyces thailandica]